MGRTPAGRTGFTGQGRGDDAIRGAGPATARHVAHCNAVRMRSPRHKVDGGDAGPEEDEGVGCKGHGVPHCLVDAALCGEGVCVAPGRGGEWYLIPCSAEEPWLVECAPQLAPMFKSTLVCMPPNQSPILHRAGTLARHLAQPRCPAGPLTCVGGQHAPVAGGGAVQAKQADRNHARTLGGALWAGEGEQGSERGRRLLGMASKGR